MKQGSELLELLENLYLQYIQLDECEKQKMLNYIFSNFLVDGRNIRYDYKKPFDLFAKGLSCSLNWEKVVATRNFNYSEIRALLPEIKFILEEDSTV